MLSRLLPLLMFFPAIAPAVSREMQELMRDIALLQQQVKDLQQSQDTKFTALTVMVQQTLTVRGCVPYAWPRRGNHRFEGPTL